MINDMSRISRPCYFYTARRPAMPIKFIPHPLQIRINRRKAIIAQTKTVQLELRGRRDRCKACQDLSRLIQSSLRKQIQNRILNARIAPASIEDVNR